MHAFPYELGWIHWTGFVLSAALLLYPIGRILGRIGYSPFWSLVAFVPLLNVIALWALAFSKWPLEGQTSSTTAGARSARSTQ